MGGELRCTCEYGTTAISKDCPDHGWNTCGECWHFQVDERCRAVTENTKACVCFDEHRKSYGDMVIPILYSFRDAERSLLAYRASPDHVDDDARERELETARDLAIEDFKRLARGM